MCLSGSIPNACQGLYLNDIQNSIHGDEIVRKWPVNTLLIASDSIFNNLEEKRLKKYNFNTKVRCFSGSTISDMYDYLTPLLKKEPDHILLHVGSNNTATMSSGRILDDLLKLKLFIQTKLPNTKIILSQPTIRNDNAKASFTTQHLVTKLKELNITMLDNGNVNDSHLRKKGLHLNSRGTARIAMNIISLMKCL